jgi:hypothetical protein
VSNNEKKFDVCCRVVDGRLVLELDEISDHLDDDDARRLAKHVIWDRAMGEVVQYLATGEEPDGWWCDGRSLAEHRLKLMALWPATVRGVVKELLAERDNAEERSEKHERWARALRSELYAHNANPSEVEKCGFRISNDYDAETHLRSKGVLREMEEAEKAETVAKGEVGP